MGSPEAFNEDDEEARIKSKIKSRQSSKLQKVKSSNIESEEPK